jgi:glycerol transport system ATP-binding protein
MNLVTGEVQGDTLRLPGGVAGPRPRHFESVDDGPVTVGLRPHLLSLEAPSGDAIALGGELLLAELTGSATYLHVEVGEAQSLVAEVPGVQSHPLGERLEIFIRPEMLFAFDETTGDLLANPTGAAAAWA